MDSGTIQALATTATPFISAIVERWLVPKLERSTRNEGLESALYPEVTREHFEEYLSRGIAKCSVITTVALQSGPVQLADVYIPLTLKAMSGDAEVVLDTFPSELLQRHARLLITDTAGMGKSTILRYVLLSCIAQNAAIPIMIELRKLSEAKSVVEVLQEELNAIDEVFDHALLLKLIRRGDFCFLLDGYDEIPVEHRDKVTSVLQDFIAKSGKNTFILTSRPEPGLASFIGFQRFTIRPLKPIEAYELLRKYDQGRDWADVLIANLRRKEARAFREFLVNPLLVSLLYRAYSFKPMLPVRKHIFYRQVYDALFETHDLSKGGAFIRQKHSRLDIEEFHRVLRALGYRTMTLNKIEYDKDEILNHITEVRGGIPGVAFGESEFLKDLLTCVPLFVKDGALYRWAHKAIQEYFAAQFICIDAKAQGERILAKMYESDNAMRYIQVWDMCYDMDYKLFRRSVIRPLAEEFVAYARADVLGSSTSAPSGEAVAARRSLMFGTIAILVPGSVRDGKTKGFSDAFPALVDRLTTESLLPDNWVDVRMVRTTEGGAVVSATLPARQLIEMLADKRDDLVIEKVPIHVSSRRTSTWLSIGVKDLWDGDEPVAISEDPKLRFNARTRFSRVNALLSRMWPGGYLEIDRCTQLIEAVQREIKQEKGGRFLLDNL